MFPLNRYEDIIHDNELHTPLQNDILVKIWDVWSQRIKKCVQTVPYLR